MRLIVDTNVLISALLKDSITREILLLPLSLVPKLRLGTQMLLETLFRFFHSLTGIWTSAFNENSYTIKFNPFIYELNDKTLISFSSLPSR